MYHFFKLFFPYVVLWPDSFTVRNLSAMVVDSHTVHLSWVPPDTAGDVAWYRITWRSQARTRRQRRQSTGVRDRVRSQVVPGNATSANISVDLSRGHVEFSVQASHESGLAGDMVNIVPRGQGQSSVGSVSCTYTSTPSPYSSPPQYHDNLSYGFLSTSKYLYCLP